MWSLLRRFIIVLCIEYLLLQPVIAQECTFQWNNGTDLKIPEFGINLPKVQDIAEPNTLLLSFIANNVKDFKVDSKMISTIPYVRVTLENNMVKLYLAEHFVNYEEEEFDYSLNFDVIFTCSTDTEIKMEFTQPIEDTNNHEPEFQNTPYVYKLPMPFPKGVSLQQFASISARDIDLTNTNVTFYLDKANPNTDGFSICCVSKSQKLHSASLITNAVLDFMEDVTFILYANDTGNPPRTGKTNITIQVDHANSIIRFAKSLYTANLTNLNPENANGKRIEFVEGEITLGGGVDNTVSYKIQDDLTGYGEHFKHTILNNHMQIRLIDPPKKFFNESFVLLTVTAKKTAGNASTVLYMSLPGSRNAVTTTEDVANSSDNSVPVIVLGVFLALTIVCLIGIAVKYHRIRTKPPIREPAMNNNRTVVPEMEEVVQNGSVSPSGSFRKSVAFNDTVEEIKIARL